MPACGSSRRASRSQVRNRAAAEERLLELLASALYKRAAVRPPQLPARANAGCAASGSAPKPSGAALDPLKMNDPSPGKRVAAYV